MGFGLERVFAGEAAGCIVVGIAPGVWLGVVDVGSQAAPTFLLSHALPAVVQLWAP